MGYSMKRIIAVFLCMILCMTNMELYAAETDNTGSGGLEEEMQTAVDETEVMETVSLYLEESEPAETDEPETADIEPTKTETAETEPDETETETVETEPDETETKPDETEPDETETQISETETVASEIAETEALETELTDEQSEQSVEELLSELQEEVDRQFQEDGYCASGYIDSGFEADRLGNPAFGRRTFGLYADRETLPSAYSAVDAGQVSAIRNQGAWGTCWSFAAMAAAESAYKKLYGREADLSETHLVNFFYHDGLAGPDGGLEGE